MASPTAIHVVALAQLTLVKPVYSVATGGITAACVHVHNPPASEPAEKMGSAPPLSTPTAIHDVEVGQLTLEKLPPPVVSGATAVISGGSVEYGVASMDGFENPLSPEAFIAATVKKYVSPLLRPDTVQLVNVTESDVEHASVSVSEVVVSVAVTV
jgi:hypothetical protein